MIPMFSAPDARTINLSLFWWPFSELCAIERQPWFPSLIYPYFRAGTGLDNQMKGKIWHNAFIQHKEQIKGPHMSVASVDHGSNMTIVVAAP